jgi:hypothetical protein
MSGWQPRQDPRQRPDAGQWNETGLPPWNGQQQPPQQQWSQPPPNYWQQPYAPPPGPPPRRKKSRKGLAFLGCGGLAAVVILVAVIAGASSSSSSPGSSSTQTQAAAPPAQSAAAAAAPAKQTVTYEVSGSDADVTYGPTGSDLSGSVPMNKTQDIPSKPPLYYSVQAQLQGGGTVTCKIKVDGKVISQSTASGGYNIAQCEIGQDPFSGNWQDDNQG